MNNKNVRLIQTNEEFKIFANQYRMKIIDVYTEYNKPMTVKMVADILGEVPAKIHYHVQKLLKIEILVLDHIEIINGINAKYYVLKDQFFRISIQDDTSPKMKSFQVDATVNVFAKYLSSFKFDIIQRAENAKLAGNFQKDDGFILYRKVYLTEDELNEFKGIVDNFINKHRDSDNSKNKFSIISGSMKIDKSSE